MWLELSKDGKRLEDYVENKVASHIRREAWWDEQIALRMIPGKTREEVRATIKAEYAQQCRMKPPKNKPPTPLPALPSLPLTPLKEFSDDQSAPW
jgi:hypothetical protein